MAGRLAAHLAAMLPGSGRPVRSLRCQYTLTPDRDFVIAPVPGHPAVVVGLGAAHGFKFAPTFGRLLADLAVTGVTDTDLTAVPAGPSRPDRPRLPGALAGVMTSPATTHSSPGSRPSSRATASATQRRSWARVTLR